MRIISLIAVAGITLALTTTVASAGTGLEPYGPAGNGSLVYAVDGDLHAADATGANGVAIITDPATDSAPSLSRDGTRIAFLREEAGAYPRLMVARADGTDVVALSDATDLFDWSPDGTQLVVNHDVGGKPWVSIIAADGSGDVQPLDLDGIEPDDGWAAWRPNDGSELIFTGHPRAGSSDRGLYAIRPDGTGLRTIGPMATSESDQQISFNEPQLSPDGSRVAYWNWELSDAGVLDGYLHLRDLDTGVDHRVRARPQPEAEIDPRFSPDGTMIVIEAQSETEDLSQLVVAPVDGSQPGVSIGPTFSYKDDSDFAFSPDGAKVVLTVNGVTSIIDVTTGRATIMPGIPSFPAWQRMAPA
jgi:Tol biopolymer transport system component